MKQRTLNLFFSLLFILAIAVGITIKVKSDLQKDIAKGQIDSQESTMGEGLGNEPKLRGILEIKGGDILERDIIPKLRLIFDLTEQEVKESLARPLTSDLIREELTDFRRMEGIIPPGSYEIPKDETLGMWLKRMVKAAENRYTNLLARIGQTNSLKPLEQVILASIVEAECLANKHYTEAAAVFLNRLADQSALQSCVTAEYAVGYQRAFLYEEDVNTQNPYNTYFVKGLPAGPICCVDEESLMAAIQPSQDQSLYFFYYDYLLNEMFFYADYATFAKEASKAQERFVANPPVGMHEKINKQTLFGFR